MDIETLLSRAQEVLAEGRIELEKTRAPIAESQKLLAHFERTDRGFLQKLD